MFAIARFCYILLNNSTPDFCETCAKIIPTQTFWSKKRALCVRTFTQSLADFPWGKKLPTLFAPRGVISRGAVHRIDDIPLLAEEWIRTPPST